MDKLDREKRKRPAPDRTDKYKAEKEYWMAEKALKFARKADVGWEDAAVDRSNMLLFPTIASCTSSDSEEEVGGDLQRAAESARNGADSSEVDNNTPEASNHSPSNNTQKRGDEDTNQLNTPQERRHKHHHHRHRHHHRKQFLVSYQTHIKSNAS